MSEVEGDLQDEVLCNINNAVSDDTHSGVVPWHASILGFANLVLLPVIHVVEIHNPVVIKVPRGCQRLFPQSYSRKIILARPNLCLR